MEQRLEPFEALRGADERHDLGGSAPFARSDPRDDHEVGREPLFPKDGVLRIPLPREPSIVVVQGRPDRPRASARPWFRPCGAPRASSLRRTRTRGSEQLSLIARAFSEVDPSSTTITSTSSTCSSTLRTAAGTIAGRSFVGMTTVSTGSASPRRSLGPRPSLALIVGPARRRGRCAARPRPRAPGHRSDRVAARARCPLRPRSLRARAWLLGDRRRAAGAPGPPCGRAVP